MKIRDRISLWIVLLSCFSFPLMAQNTQLSIALDHLSQQQEKWNLSATDLQDVVVTDQYQSAHNGVTHIYFTQRYNGIKIYNAIAGVHLNKEDKVAYSNHKFWDKLSERVSSSTSTLNATNALVSAARALKLPTPDLPQVLSRSAQSVTFVDREISRSPIPSELLYYPTKDGQLQLCWNLFIEDPRGSEGWNIFVSAADGSVLDKIDQTIYCRFGNDHNHEHNEDCQDHSNTKKNIVKRISGLSLNVADGATYNVYPAPVESPKHGERTMIVDPADLTASPFGWHDTNGSPGPEYTITRGNNVHAYRDAVPDDLPDSDEPNGGDELIFDFPYTIQGNPEANSEASITQLFYMNNYVHDFTYHFGFDEPAGNYQQNNYGNSGQGGDVIRAEAQDGSGINNANFLPSRDGTPGRMQMFLWSFGGSTNFVVSSPEDLADNYSFSTAAFGPQVIETLEGELVSSISGDPNPNVACTDILNTPQVAGKIVLIDRGDCFFEEKAVNAEEAGAIACVICNNTTGLISMSGVDTIPDPSIPTIMLSQSDCALFRQRLETGETINVSIQAPDFFDSGHDNGIIAHEYGHGISTRLTGGPSSPFCLNNNEQMGEGWSDFFALITTIQAGDDGVNPRGIGTFAAGQATTGRGIRRQRYSTDITLNTQTYDDVIGTGAPHPLGEVWVSALWDIYWALADEYGFNLDPTDATAGNNIAIQLVMDGMKLQTCRPGFIDGRDAIIAADLINNNGANECLLWEIFARRGLGWSAIQGQSNTRNDNIEAFDLRPECIQELKVSKTSTPVIQRGETFTISINVRNDKTDAVSGVVVSDILPEGASYVPGSTVGADEPQLQGDLLLFDIGDLSSGRSLNITYQLESDPARFSTSIFLDDVEQGRLNWNTSNLGGSDLWRISTDTSSSGLQSWFVPNTVRSNDQALQLIRPLELTVSQPVLRFTHNYDIEPGVEGGIVETSTNGISWEPVEENSIFREAFVGRVAQNTFGIAGQNAYWGDSEGFVTSYVDLSAFNNDDLRFRFRYSSDIEEGDNPPLTDGWFVDDIEVIDMFNYASEVCVASNEGDNVCAMPEGRGTIVETDLATSTENILSDGLQVDIFPNPTYNQINISLQGTSKEAVQIQLLSLDGKILQQEKLASGLISESKQLNVTQLPRGMYFVKVLGENTNLVERIVVQ